MPSLPPETSSDADLFSLSGRDALIIGGAGLLGGELTHAFAEHGARVIIASRDLEKCTAFAKQVSEKFPSAEVCAFGVDITDPPSINRLMDDVGAITGGGLDVLVNSAWSGRKNTFESITDADWDFDIEIGLNGPFRCIKAAFPLLKQRRGNILSIASIYGHVAPDYRLYESESLANPPSYGAAKAGVIQLTKYLASFLAPHGIRANCISPGPFPYEQTQKDNPEFIDRLAAKTPLNRIGMPHELKGVALLLCSEAGSYLNGQNLCIDGGWAVW